jgi:hypothetical protein
LNGPQNRIFLLIEKAKILEGRRKNNGHPVKSGQIYDGVIELILLNLTW